MAGFMSALKKEITSVTENGALGYKYTENPLLDIAFKVPTLRREAESENLYDKYFKDAYDFDNAHSLKWLLYLRDIRGGLGERDAFRNIFANSPTKIQYRLITECDLAEFGRWDDIVYAYSHAKSDSLKFDIARYISKKLDEDLSNMDVGKPCSLLAKWMPSINASSKKTRKIALDLAKDLKLTKATYRCILSSLRKYLNIIEDKMSNNKWDEIDYNQVPSKANILYQNAFMRHDEERRTKYLEDLKEGKEGVKINSSASMPYDIVHSYLNGGNYCSYSCWGNSDNIEEENTVLEEMWKALPEYITEKCMIPVVDVSGSMTTNIGNKSSVCAMDVSVAMGIYCAQHNKSKEYGNKFITFSAKPDFVNIGNGNLKDHINAVMKSDSAGLNTNIEAVFDLILKTAIANNLKQEELPESILIISDMEFDMARRKWNYGFEDNDLDQDTLMETISNKYADKGYEIPKLIFWNVNSRTDTIPITKNKNGLILVSGFSTSIFNMVCSNELDPYKALCNELDVPRYSVIDKMIANFDK